MKKALGVLFVALVSGVLVAAFLTMGDPDQPNDSARTDSTEVR